jgi:hypothetical protein
MVIFIRGDTMEIHVFDHIKNVVKIRLEDVIQVKRIDRRLCYLTEEGKFYGAVNLKEQALLYAGLGISQVDKNSLINTNKIEKIEGRNAIINNIKYPISRREFSKLARNMRSGHTV